MKNASSSNLQHTTATHLPMVIQIVQRRKFTLTHIARVENFDVYMQPFLVQFKRTLGGPVVGHGFGDHR